MPTTSRLAASLLAVGLAIAGCAGSRATTAPPAQPAPPPPVVAPPVAHEPAIQRINGGSWPGSNTHRWGSRFYEVRQMPTGLEVRTHDAIDFQGVGMQPKDMSPTRHECTAWEPLPATITTATAETIEAFYKTTPGRSPADC